MSTESIKEPRECRSIRLPDGRRLACLDAGVWSGVPLLFLHGLPSWGPWSHLFFLSRFREIVEALRERAGGFLA